MEMKELQKKQKLKKKLYSPWALALLVLVVIFLAKGTYQVFQKRQGSVDHVSTLESKVQDLQTKESRLRANIDALQTEAGIEKEVKEKFNVSKEGEHVAILVDDLKAPISDMQVNIPWYKRFWNAIISR